MRRVALLVGTVVLAVAAVGCGSDRKGAATTTRHAGRAVVVVQRGYLVAFPLDGSKSVRLAKLPGHDATVSSDGKMVAFVTRRGISTMRIDGSHIRTVTHGDDVTPSWSADGQTLYFARYFTFHECGSILSAAVSGGSRAGSPTASKILTPDNHPGNFHSYEEPAVSPDGTRIAFSEWEGCVDAGGDASPRLRVLDLNGQPTADLQELPRNGFYPNPEHSGPAWSPDGAHIAYRRNADLAVANNDGSNQRILINGRGLLIYDAPAWSPDGAWIAFTRDTLNDGEIVEIVHPDGSNRRVIAKVKRGAGEPLAGWLPDS